MLNGIDTKRDLGEKEWTTTNRGQVQPVFLRFTGPKYIFFLRWAKKITNKTKAIYWKLVKISLWDVFRRKQMAEQGSFSDPHFSSKDMLNKNLDISELVNKLMVRRRQQLDAQYVSLTHCSWARNFHGFATPNAVTFYVLISQLSCLRIQARRPYYATLPNKFLARNPWSISIRGCDVMVGCEARKISK